ncbi:MAG: cysteine desulfurase [Candidatus Thermoplasmatota archaeon]|nr:cysteine desulfurase [Candidatus Thermoplasmatota archaeon]MBS3789325.1 cysteine desulfurase [Candidatus Thermoplasmatota archaeon]
MDIEKIRKDFPVVDDYIYFDSACLSLKPQPVIDAVQKYYSEFPVCEGKRSAHTLSTRLTKEIKKGRKSVKDLLNASEIDEIAFTKNTTEAINTVARGLPLKKGDKVLTTDKEHNSNLVPWIKMREKREIIYEQVSTDKDGQLDLEELKEKMDESVKIVSMVHTSNLDGTTTPASEVADIAHENDAYFMLDGAQSVPHKPVDVKDIGVDFLAFSVHKMLGPTGVGVLYGRKKLLEELDPLIYGGGGVRSTRYDEATLQDSPAKFEAGLQNFASLAAVKPAVDYIKEIGLENIEEHEIKLNTIATEELKEKVKIIGPEDPEKRSGIFNFQLEELGCHEITLLMDEENILLRGGKQCVHSWYSFHGLEGGNRASFYLYNTEEEVKKFVEVIRSLVF